MFKNNYTDFASIICMPMKPDPIVSVSMCTSSYCLLHRLNMLNIAHCYVISMWRLHCHLEIT